MNPTTNELRQRLEALRPSHLVINDDSHLHAGHAGNTGGSHYSIEIASPLFAGKTTLQRHRIVLDAAGDLMKNKIHAMAIKLIEP